MICLRVRVLIAIRTLPAGAKSHFMRSATKDQKRRGPLALGALVGRVIDPVIAKRGFAKAELLSAWPEIAGPHYASCTAPERIAWPRRGDTDEAGAGVLFLKVDGPRAILVQHELPAIVERVNQYFGYRAIGQARIVQAPVSMSSRETAPKTQSEGTGNPPEEATPDQVAALEPSPLKDALTRLGQGVKRSTRE